MSVIERLPTARKPVIFMGSSLEDLSAFPTEVKQVMGYAIHLAQTEGKHPDAKPMKFFKGAGVLEVVDDFGGDTYRAVYTVKLKGVVYVLHAFEKKSKSGIKTPPADMSMIQSRLKAAQNHYAEHFERKRTG